MITYEEALKIAREHKPNADNCVEYENGYIFGTHGDENYTGGYGHGAVVILKKNGDVARIPEFVMGGKSGKLVRMFELDGTVTLMSPEEYGASHRDDDLKKLQEERQRLITYMNMYESESLPDSDYEEEPDPSTLYEQYKEYLTVLFRLIDEKMSE